jgi:aspartate aminotransferase
MELRYAKRMTRLGTETAFVVLAKAKALERQGRNIIHLEIGEPDFATPRNICDAAVEALNQGYTHYGPSAGLQEVREAVAEYGRKRCCHSRCKANHLLLSLSMRG